MSPSRSAAPRALLSVSDKSGIAELGRALVERGWELVSTGGTARTLREAGLSVMEVADLTGHPEMMEGRVKTLHPAVHAGLLARRDREDDMSALADQGYGAIDLVAVNLYPFRETVAGGGVSLAEAMEKVDIGGPTMIRAAAKNHPHVWVVVEPADYDRVLAALDAEAGEEGTEGGSGPDAAALRRELAAKVFRHVSAYDAAVADHLADRDADGAGVRTAEPGADPFRVSIPRRQSLRYGENPDQEAAFHAFGDSGLGGLTQHHGKELSYNNILDLDGALLCLSPFAFSSRAACCIIKHTTPAGLAVGDDLTSAYERALATDPLSSFGSVIAVNRPVDRKAAEAMSRLFIECVVAPGFADGAMEVLTEKKNIRLLTFPGVGETLPFEPTDDPAWESRPPDEKAAARFIAAQGRLPSAVAFRSVYGGALVQTPPLPPFYGVDGGEWSVATERAPTEAEWDDLRFAWAAVFGVKSNAILLARGGATLGIGAGQMSRVDSSKIAVRKAADAELDLEGSVLASDAFFPFRDGVDAAADAGVRAIVQPGGSVRDDEVVAAANEHDIAMVLTGRRLFRH